VARALVGKRLRDDLFAGRLASELLDYRANGRSKGAIGCKREVLFVGSYGFLVFLHSLVSRSE